VRASRGAPSHECLGPCNVAAAALQTWTLSTTKRLPAAFLPHDVTACTSREQHACDYSRRHWMTRIAMVQSRPQSVPHDTEDLQSTRMQVDAAEPRAGSRGNRKFDARCDEGGCSRYGRACSGKRDYGTGADEPSLS
jgi:hypothetical protein